VVFRLEEQNEIELDNGSPGIYIQITVKGSPINGNYGKAGHLCLWRAMSP
jgi:hypothetical protein